MSLVTTMVHEAVGYKRVYFLQCSNLSVAFDLQAPLWKTGERAAGLPIVPAEYHFHEGRVAPDQDHLQSVEANDSQDDAQ